jgi:hypothetical protein
MRSERSPFIRLAVESDNTVFVQAYTNTDQIRIRFDEGGFIPDGVFRYAEKVARNRGIIPQGDARTVAQPDGSVRLFRGPVTITARAVDDGAVTMEVAIKLPDGSGTARKFLNAETCDEIGVRLRMIDSALDSYFKKEYERVEQRSSGKSNGAPARTGTLVARTS